ncbi:hypothetical protein OEZ86_011175 [Tetradesmus obliquus]|nr:hypothetical protein OEZ86_011175 [Tetradesmus obliquus]
MERLSSARVRKTLYTVSRLCQVVLCIIVLVCSAYEISRFGGLDAVNFAMFASITGMAISLLLVLGPAYNPVLAERLPGIIDCILSGLWSLFFLATGGALAAYREFACATFSSYYWFNPYAWYGRRLLLAQDLPAAAGRSLLARPECGAWDATVAMSFLAFAAYAVSCVLAGLDIKDGKGLVKPRGFKPATPELPVAAKGEKSTATLVNPV